MAEPPQNFLDRVHRRQRRIALASWDNEGGGGPGGRPQEAGVPGDPPPRQRTPELTDAELVQLQIRVIALESLMIAVLAAGSARQRQLALKMADHISPRPGFTAHRQTIHAAAEIASLVDRATRLRSQSRAGSLGAKKPVQSHQVPAQQAR